jgi:transaldolase
MKIFLDTADRKAIEKWKESGIVNGVTTNPTHLSKEGGDPKQVVMDICYMLPNGDISVEVTEKDPKGVYEQAKEIAALANNVVVKVPCAVEYYPVIKRLVQEDGVNVNVTLLFTLIQGLLMSKIGVRYISPFVGRLDDIDSDGIEVLFNLSSMMQRYAFLTEVLAASIRTVRNVHDAIDAGCQAITLPIDILEKMVRHPLTEQGMVKFLEDWQKLGIKKFP